MLPPMFPRFTVSTKYVYWLAVSARASKILFFAMPHLVNKLIYPYVFSLRISLLICSSLGTKFFGVSFPFTFAILWNIASASCIRPGRLSSHRGDSGRKLHPKKTNIVGGPVINEMINQFPLASQPTKGNAQSPRIL